jgi:hypothetical protein
LRDAEAIILPRISPVKNGEMFIRYHRDWNGFAAVGRIQTGSSATGPAKDSLCKSQVFPGSLLPRPVFWRSSSIFFEA